MSDKKDQYSSQNTGDQISKMASDTFNSGYKMFQRFVKKTEAAIKGTEVTPLDSNLEMLISRAEIFRQTIEELVTTAEMVTEPDPLIRNAGKIMNIVDTGIKGPSYVSNMKRISVAMLTHAQKVPSNTSFWQSLIAGGNVFKDGGNEEVVFNAQIKEKFIAPLNEILNTEYKQIQETKDDLFSLRLDMDALKSKMKSGVETSDVVSECRKLTSDFELICLKLQGMLDSFCGAEGQTKLSNYIYLLVEIFKDYHMKSFQLYQNFKKL